MSPADIAMAHGDYAKAETLYASESQAAGNLGPDSDRLHAALIRAQLRQSKIAAAEKDALAWLSAQPTNSWALVAVSEVEWRKGQIHETVQTLEKARTLDFCNPQVHADSAIYYRFGGLFASANRELTLARKLDPIDDDIESEWIGLQPRAVQLAELTSYLQRATYLSDDDRKDLMQRKERLSAPPGSGCHLASSVTSTSIPFLSIQDSPESRPVWGLNVTLNGNQRRLEIDTGASGLVLSKSAAKALHLNAESHFVAGGFGDSGGVDSFYAKVKSIKIGALEFQDCDVAVIDENISEAVDGLIGGDVFSHFLFTLDFPGRLVKLDPLPPRPGDTAEHNVPSLETGVSIDSGAPQDPYRDPSMKDWDAIWRNGHELILPVQLNSPTAPQKLFIVDTGSFADLISPDAAREVGTVSKGSWIQMAGLSGEVKKTWSTGPMKLYFSHLVAPTEGMLSVDTGTMTRGAGIEISGFLGAPSLHQLTVSIDYRDYLIHFAYDPKRLHRCAAAEDTTGDWTLADCY